MLIGVNDDANFVANVVVVVAAVLIFRYLYLSVFLRSRLAWDISRGMCAVCTDTFGYCSSLSWLYLYFIGSCSWIFSPIYDVFIQWLQWICIISFHLIDDDTLNDAWLFTAYIKRKTCDVGVSGNPLFSDPIADRLHLKTRNVVN